jgi:hypothetical protein
MSVNLGKIFKNMGKFGKNGENLGKIGKFWEICEQSGDIWEIWDYKIFFFNVLPLGCTKIKTGFLGLLVSLKYYFYSYFSEVSKVSNKH